MHEFVRRVRRRLDRIFRSGDETFVRGVRYGHRHWRLLLVWGMSLGLFFSGVILLWAATLELPDLKSLEPASR